MRIVNYPNGIVGQFADEGEWLCKDFNESDRLFEKVVSFGKNNEPWQVCTDAEKVEWEEEHRPKPQPEPDETQEAEII